LWCSFCPGFDIDIRFGTIWEGFKEMQNISVGIFRPSPVWIGIPNQPVSTSKVNSYLAKQSSIGKQNRNAQY
jgi:hypothetical protein